MSTSRRWPPLHHEIGSRRLGAVAWAAVLLALVVLPAQAAAHTPGSSPVAKTGTFTLTPEGTPTGTYHVYFSQMGFPIGTGDTFEINWTANDGRGPDIYFEIHTHEHGWTRYYTTNATNLSLSWTVPPTNQPANDSFMLYWVNHYPVSVNVSYDIVDKAPPTDLTYLLAVPLVVGAGFGWFLWMRSVPEEERQGPGGKPVAPGSGAEEGSKHGEPRSEPIDDEAFQRAVMEQEAAKQKGEPPGSAP